jgi:hypothetical protein
MVCATKALGILAREHFDRTGIRQLRTCMCVDAQTQRAIDTLLSVVITNGLTDGKHMPVVGAVFERRNSVPRSAN